LETADINYLITMV